MARVTSDPVFYFRGEPLKGDSAERSTRDMASVVFPTQDSRRSVQTTHEARRGAPSDVPRFEHNTMTLRVPWRPIARIATVLVLAAAILSIVIHKTGEPYARAIVHVSESGVAVQLDNDVPRDVESFEELPFVFTLRPGRHRFTLRRGDAIEDAQEIEVVAGSETVLCLWNRKEFAARVNEARHTALNHQTGQRKPDEDDGTSPTLPGHSSPKLTAAMSKRH